MWTARNKTDLIIEVWEKLDCESVGAVELEAIEVAIESEFGSSAIDSPMVTARLLADEGAELRHSEIMELYLQRTSERPSYAPLAGILKTNTLDATLRSIRELEMLRVRYTASNDKVGLRSIRDVITRERKNAVEASQNERKDAAYRSVSSEIAEWLRIWIQTPEVFFIWVDLRRKSADFVDKFGRTEEE